MKDKIIEAVIEEFNEKGIKFTMDDISRRLGISKRTLYSYVNDKESLFVEAVDCVFAAIKVSEKEILENDLLDQIEKIRRILIVLPQKYKAIDFCQLYELKNKFPRIYAKIEKRLETDWEPTLQLLEAAMAEGRIKKVNLTVFRAIITGTIENLLGSSLLSDNHINYEDALDEMVDMILNGIMV